MEIVRRVVDAYAAGDIEAALAAYDAGVEFDVSTARPEGGVFHGPQGVEEGVRVWIERWDAYSYEVEEIVDAGDRILIDIRESGRGESSGVEVTQHTYWVNTLRDGKIVRAELFNDRKRALAAAGLSG